VIGNTLGPAFISEEMKKLFKISCKKDNILMKEAIKEGLLNRIHKYFPDFKELNDLEREINQEKRKMRIGKDGRKNIRKKEWWITQKRGCTAPRIGCKTFIKKHHNEMKDDPERLTSEFLVRLTGCNCKRIEVKE
jgi:hypothetical protein